MGFLDDEYEDMMFRLSLTARRRRKIAPVGRPSVRLVFPSLTTAGFSFLNGWIGVSDSSTHPGHINLRSYSAVSAVGYWRGTLPNPMIVSRDTPFSVVAVEVCPGNYSNAGISFKGLGPDGEEISDGGVFYLDTDAPARIVLNMQGISKLSMLPVDTGSAVLQPGAFGTSVSSGSRPRPPVYNLDFAISALEIES